MGAMDRSPPRQQRSCAIGTNFCPFGIGTIQLAKDPRVLMHEAPSSFEISSPTCEGWVLRRKRNGPFLVLILVSQRMETAMGCPEAIASALLRPPGQP
eukprot:2677127-Rhodomonas_salina.4